MKDELHYIWQSNKSVRGADGRVSSLPPLGGAGLLCLGKERGPTGDGRAAEHCLKYSLNIKHVHKPRGCDSLSDVFLQKKIREKMDSVKNPLPTVKVRI